MPKCNLLIPAFPKSGTSSLHEYLALHPDICMSQDKEPQFFAVTTQWQRGFEWYDSLFDDGGRPCRWYGESSQSYGVWEPALQRIEKHLKKPKCFVLLRHPVDRLISQYRWLWALKMESRPLSRALEDEQEKIFDIDALDKFTAYRLCSHYTRLYPMMEKYLGKDQILYLDSARLARNPQETLDLCFQFLDLEPISIQTAIRSNSTDSIRVWRTMGLGILLKPIPAAVRARLDPDARLRLWVKGFLGKRKRTPPPTTDEDREYLTELLAEDIAFYHEMFPNRHGQEDVQEGALTAGTLKSCDASAGFNQ